MNLVFWWLLLVYSMRLGRTFGGVWGGRLAVALVACDPNLLGHASLATTDMLLVACMLVFVYHFYHCYRPDAGILRAAYSCLACCTVWALTAKASGAGVRSAGDARTRTMEPQAKAGTLHPASGQFRSAARSPTLWHATYQFRKDYIAIGFIGLVTLFVYCGSDWGTEPTFIKWTDGLPEGDLERGVMTPP